MGAVRQFSPGTPSIVEISARRLLAPQDAPRGKLVTNIETKQTLSDDSRTLHVQMIVTVEGKSEDEAVTAFTSKCEVECVFQFSEAVPVEDVESNKTLAIIGGPLYQRAALQLQDVAWRMGYTAIRVPLYIDYSSPSEFSEVPVEADEVKPSKARRRKAKPAE